MAHHLANVEFGLEMRGIDTEQRRKTALELIRLVGLGGFEQRYPSELSGGESAISWVKLSF